MSFGGLAAPSFTVVDATTITAITPPRTSAGTVDVAVANYAGTGTLSAAFTYKVSSIWYYDAANNLWTFYIPGATATAKGIGDLTTVPAALASLIVVTK